MTAEGHVPIAPASMKMYFYSGAGHELAISETPRCVQPDHGMGAKAEPLSYCYSLGTGERQDQANRDETESHCHARQYQEVRNKPETGPKPAPALAKGRIVPTGLFMMQCGVPSPVSRIVDCPFISTLIADLGIQAAAARSLHFEAVASSRAGHSPM